MEPNQPATPCHLHRMPSSLREGVILCSFLVLSVLFQSPCLRSCLGACDRCLSSVQGWGVGRVSPILVLRFFWFLFVFQARPVYTGKKSRALVLTSLNKLHL